MKTGDKVRILNLPYLSPYWRGREGKITSIHDEYCELDIGGYFTPFRESELEIVENTL
jgi:hypothetical protein